jgi:hypothetical protein
MKIIGKVMRQTTVYQRLLPLLRSFGKSNGSDIIIYVYDVYAYTYIYINMNYIINYTYIQIIYVYYVSIQIIGF